MRKVLLFGAMLLALTAPIAAQAQQSVDDGPGGIFLIPPGRSHTLDGKIVPSPPPYGWDDLKGGYPVVQARMTVDKTTVHPGDNVRFDYVLLDMTTQKIELVFGSPQWEEVWLTSVENDPKRRPTIIKRLLADDPSNNPASWHGGISQPGVGSRTFNYYFPAIWPCPSMGTIYDVHMVMPIPKDIKRGQYIDLCVAITPNGFPVNEPLQLNGFPIGTIGWAKVRLYVE